MKKILGVFVLSAFTLLGCISLAQLRGNTYSYTHKLAGDNITDNIYEDNDLKITFSVGTKEIDFEVYNKNLQAQIGAGIDGIILGGSLGEV